MSGELEIDEALFGGHRKGKRGWGSEGKSLVFGIYQRNGKVITFPVSDRKHDTLIPLIKQHTKKGSLYYTDDHTAYATLNLIGKHQIILHGKEEYVRDDATHINGIEGFWSYAKTWLYHYRGIPKSYFELYLKEIELRFNIYFPKGSSEFNAIEECWRQGKYDLLVSKYYPKFANFRHTISNYYRTRRFKLDIVKYLSRSVS